MRFVCALIWGILTAAVMTATVRFYLPCLSGRKLKAAGAQAADENAPSGAAAETAEKTACETAAEPAGKAADETAAETTEKATDDAAAEMTEKATDEAAAETGETASEEAAATPQMPVAAQPAAEKRELFPGYERRYFRRDGVLIFIMVLCGLWAGVCGYLAAENAASLMSLLKMSLGMLVLSCVFFTDLELLTIPNLCSLVLLGGRAVSVLLEFLILPETAVSWLLNSLIALAVSFAVLYLMNRLTRGGIGMGDVKLYSSLGFLCGVRAVVYTLLFSFLLCAVLSVILILTKKKTMKDSLPMGPFIWAGYGLAVILGVM